MNGLTITKKISLFFLALALASLQQAAQFTEIGANEPPGLKWRKIETGHFTIVFPESLTLEAKKVAATAEHFFKTLLESSPKTPKPLTLVLSNHGIISNAYFRLAPRMAEWFHMPINSHLTGVVDWYDLLASHEGRHVIQFEELNYGLIKIAGILLGELGRSGASFQAAPTWLLEGDSVVTETELTSGGRGRSPAFDLDIRTILLSGIRYGYRKAYFGSFKDWYPDHYRLGFLLVAYAKETYGPDIVHKLLWNSAHNSNFLFPFGEAVRQETGSPVKTIYEQAMNDLQAFWTHQQSLLDLTQVQRINNRESKVWTNYLFPRFDSDGSLYVQKIGLEKPMTLFRLWPEGREEKVTQMSPHQGMFNRLSVGKGKACWSEAVPDARWGKRVYSNVVVFDIESGKTRRLTKKSKLFDPSLSPDGKSLAAVEYSPESLCVLVVLDSETGLEIRRFPNPGNDFLMTPSWSEDGAKIVFIQQGEQGRILSLVDVNSGKIQALTSPSYENISHPVLFKNFVFFNSPYSGIDNIYALDMENQRRSQVTSSRFGAYFPDVSPDGLSLVYSSYTADGYDAVEMSFDPSAWRKMDSVVRVSLPFFDPAGEENPVEKFPQSDVRSDGDYEVKKYRPLSHVLNIHSWMPFPLPPDLGFFLFSNDKLNLATLSGGVNYNLNEKVLGFEVDGIYSGLWPILDFGLGYRGRSTTDEESEDRTVTYGWREAFFSSGLSVPLDLSRGIYSASLTLDSNLSMIQVSSREQVDPFDNGNGLLFPLSYELHFSRFKKSAFRDLKPQWGQTLSFIYQHTPWKSDYRGSLLSAQMGFYAPGLFKHHSLVLSGACERQKPDNYRFPSRIYFPRGYDYFYLDSFFKVSIDYALPLAYPDFALDGIFYFKRLRGSVFLDYLSGQIDEKKESFTSCGLELTTDFHLFNLIVPLEIGIRLAYRLEDRTVRAELVLFDLFYDSLRTRNRW
jgi:hypothetical protein